MSRLTLRLPPSLHAELAAHSRQCGKSINQLVVDTLRDTLGQKGPAMGDERARMLAALGDLASDGMVIEEPGDADIPLLTHEELWQLMPKLSPSFSEQIIADREDRL